MRNDPNFKLLNAHQQRSTCVSLKCFGGFPTEAKNTTLYSCIVLMDTYYYGLCGPYRRPRLVRH